MQSQTKAVGFGLHYLQFTGRTRCPKPPIGKPFYGCIGRLSKVPLGEKGKELRKERGRGIPRNDVAYFGFIEVNTGPD